MEETQSKKTCECESNNGDRLILMLQVIREKLQHIVTAGCFKRFPFHSAGGKDTETSLNQF